MSRLLTLSLFPLLLGGQLLFGQQLSGQAPSGQTDPPAPPSASPADLKPAAEQPSAEPVNDSAAAGAAPNKPAEPPHELSDAEKIARLQRAIDGDQQRLGELQRKLKDFGNEFADASASFKQLDAQLEDDTKALQKLRGAGQQQAADDQQRSIDDTKKKWSLAKERFDLAIGQRKVAQEQLAALQEMAARDQAALKQLTDAPPTAAMTGLAQAPNVVAPPNASAPQAPPAPQAPSSAAPVAPAAPAATGGAAPAAPLAAPQPAAKPPSAEVEAASKVATQKEQAAQAAEKSAAEVTERLQTLDKNINLEREAIQSARKLADNAQQTLDSLDEDYEKALDSEAAAGQLQEIRLKIQNTQQRLRDAHGESRERANRLDDMQSERATTLAEQMAALQKAKSERDQADVAKRKIEELQNPFTLKNMWRWLFSHGPSLLVVLIAAVLSLWLVHVLGHRATRLIIGSGSRGSRLERENRAKTLVSVFQNTSTLAIYVGGVLMALQEAGVPIVPLIGGAAVFGLAVAFGAQNLVKDYFYGFMILLENQYGVNDVVTIAGITGLVEIVTLRMTMLRDLEGVAHFIPHSTVTTVSNMTHGWSRAVFDIGVAYSEDVDRVMDVLMQIAGKLRRDEEFGDLILADPEMLGVDSFGDSAVVIKFMLKTRPLKQWAIKRELNRRIKNKFDELGIVIPFPHRTIYHCTDNGASAHGDLGLPDRREVA